MINELKNIKSNKKQLKEFGLLIGGILTRIVGVLLYKQRPAAVYILPIGIIFCICGLFFWNILKPLQKVWMGIAVIIGFFVSRIILFILYYLVITPMSLLVRIMGKDILDQKIDKNKDSYWQDPEIISTEKESYQNQY